MQELQHVIEIYDALSIPSNGQNKYFSYFTLLCYDPDIISKVLEKDSLVFILEWNKMHNATFVKKWVKFQDQWSWIDLNSRHL